MKEGGKFVSEDMTSASAVVDISPAIRYDLRHDIHNAKARSWRILIEILKEMSSLKTVIIY